MDRPLAALRPVRHIEPRGFENVQHQTRSYK
jgi:hypothetical protein